MSAIVATPSGEGVALTVTGRPGVVVVRVPLGDGLGHLAWVEQTVDAVTTMSTPVHVPEAAAEPE